MQRTSEQGIVLVLVLWILTILMVVAFAFSSAARTEVFSTLAFKEGVENKFVAEGGVARGVVELLYRRKNAAVADGETDSWKIDGSVHEVELGGGRCMVRLLAEGGKVDINKAPEIVLRNLIANLGIKGKDGEEPEAIVDAVLDWRDGDDLVRLNGAEDDYYRSLPTPYEARDAEFESVEELLLVKGVSRELLYGDGQKRGLIDFVTVFSRAPQVNANAASREALLAIPTMTEAIADGIIGFRETREIKSQTDLVEAVGGNVGTLLPYLSWGEGSAPIYTIEAVGKGPGKKAGHAVRAVVLLDADDKYRYLYYKNPEEIKIWKEQ